MNKVSVVVDRKRTFFRKARLVILGSEAVSKAVGKLTQHTVWLEDGLNLSRSPSLNYICGTSRSCF